MNELDPSETPTPPPSGPLPAESPIPPEEAHPDPGHLSKNSLGYYIQPFFMYLVLILYVVILTGLILQRLNHHDNQITTWFWSFVHVVDDFLRAWTEE